MIVLQCHGCGKSHNLKDEFAGKKVKCPCGTALTAPDGGGSALIAMVKPGIPCPHCQVTIQAHWKGCPACGVLLLPNASAAIQAPSPAPNSKPVPASGIQVGNNSVVKADINQSFNVNTPAAMAAQFLGGVGMPPPTPAHIPSVHVGDGSVVKANIDASTNVNHHGQFVAQQTIVNVNESVVGSLVKLLTGTVFTDSAFKQADDQILRSNDPVELQSILAQTLWHMIRELKNLDKGSGVNSIRNAETSKLEAMNDNFQHVGLKASGIDKVNFLRLKLCHKIIDKLYDIEAANPTEKSTRDVEALNECILSTEKMFKWQKNKKIIKKYSIASYFLLSFWIFSCGGPALTGFVDHDPNDPKEIKARITLSVMGFVIGPGIAIGCWVWVEKRKRQFTDSMDEAESVLGDLIKKTKLS